MKMNNYPIPGPRALDESQRCPVLPDSNSVFYREATFHFAAEVERLLNEAGFTIRAWGQTLSRSLAETREIEPLQPGRGRGSFVVVSASRRP